MRRNVAIVITAVWAISYIGAVVTTNYTGFEVSTPVMLIVATYLLTREATRRNNNGNGPPR